MEVVDEFSKRKRRICINNKISLDNSIQGRVSARESSGQSLDFAGLDDYRYSSGRMTESQ